MSKRWKMWLLAAAVALIYGNILRNQFAQDDSLYITLNPTVTAPTAGKILGPNNVTNVYRPLTFATLALSYRLAGSTPWTYHIVNIVLHAAVSWLVYLVLYELLGDALVALIAAWLFALHPIHTEAVAAAVGRSELMATALMLAAWLLHTRDRQGPALIAFVLALGAKESAVVFPGFVLLGDFVRGRWKPWWRYAALGGVSLAYLAILWNVQGGHFGAALVPRLDNALVGIPAQWRVANALRIAWKYVWLQIFPLSLSCDYSFNAIPVYLRWKENLLGGAGFTALAAAWIWMTFRYARDRAGAFAAPILAIGIYFVGFATTSNVLVASGTIMGERLAYLPSMGFCLLLALAWKWLFQRQRLAAIAAMALICALFAARSVVRNRDWYDSLSLWSAAVKAQPESARVHSSLGGQYLQRKQNDLALAEFSRALEIDPDYPDAMTCYGLLAYWRHDFATAEQAMGRALNMSRRDNPNFDFMVVNYAALMMQTNRPNVALAILDREIAEAPTYSRAWSNRAALRFLARQPDLARGDAERALQLDPENPQARSVLKLLASGAMPRE